MHASLGRVGVAIPIRMRLHRRILACLLPLTLVPAIASCSWSDLRTKEILVLESHEDAEREGRSLLESAIASSGGRDRWSSFSLAEMTLEDQWQGFLGWLFRPWPGNPTELRMRYWLGMAAAEGEFLSEPRRGSVWGVDDKGFWSQAPPDKERHYSTRKSARFILRAYQYFFELPIQISNADIVLHAGERERGKKTYDLVFATWQREEPHAEHDQYLLWIAQHLDDTDFVHRVSLTDLAFTR